MADRPGPALPGALFERVDESDDALFYQAPRFALHVDEATIAALTQLYREELRAGSRVLDLMSSWVSHLPAELAFARVAGLGMNAAELAANPRLDERCVRDLNAEPSLPWPGASFDAVLCAVSVQYLVRPVDVFAEVSRVLADGGKLLIATSHRLFPTKAIAAWRALDPHDRLRLVARYLELAGGFAAPRVVDRSPAGADPLWVLLAERAPR
ncbi:MAG TPA: methyltransferase domain-containing protein [Myxococcota bacterium]|nr:methyltransferase domain-containing protein [Myxococcota bacterium]